MRQQTTKSIRPYYQKIFWLVVLALVIHAVAPAAAGRAEERGDGPKRGGNRIQKKIEVYPHRGLRSYLPENVKEAYPAALAAGGDWVDIDVVFTADKQIVGGHDLILNPDIVRNPDGTYLAKNLAALGQLSPAALKRFKDQFAVARLTLNDLRKFDVGRINADSAYAKFFPQQVAIDGARIPKLRDVIRMVKEISGGKVGFQIEMKTDPAQPHYNPDPQEFARALYKILEQEKIVDQVEIQAFDFRCLLELQRINKKIRTAYLTSRDNEPGGIDDFYHADPAVAARWTGGPVLKDFGTTIPQMVSKLGGYAWEPEDSQLTLESLNEAHRLGLKVVVWTWPEFAGQAFDEIMVNKMIDWGVDGIITDDPVRLNSILAARGYPVPKKYGCLEDLAAMVTSKVK